MADEQKEITQVEGESTSIPVKPGDKVTVTLTKEEEEIINEVKQIKARKNETEDIVDVIDNTLSLQVPAVDGTVAIIEIPENADADELDDVTLGVSEEVIADIVTLVGEGN